MAYKIDNLLDRVAHRAALRRWRRIADEAARVDLSELRALRQRARHLRRHLERMIHVAENRLALPMIGNAAVATPIGSDWSHRPELWNGPVFPAGYAGVASKQRLGNETTLHHDCTVSELTLRQIRNTRPEDLAPYGLRMDVFRFDGSFLSLVIDLPREGVEGLRKKHLVRLETIVELEQPIEMFARLNVKHGPNTDQIVRELPLHEPQVMVEFDLSYSNFNEKRVEHAWIDLIFEGPQMNQMILRDLTLSRRPRAEI
ncbi:hypothetical protein IV417_08145 [Alphaproteobacteria bacterium KMM 3653]|uniref:Uncharacterized protein n=1 Tax=Harenicola maris TaxID=2841044 RepID=A0AAP2CNV8_9RHOB|nr:hypothetical protein [Harenicola maris]